MIRKATIQDGANIAAISIQVWLDTYAHHGIRPVLSRYVLSEYSEERVRGRIESEEQIFLLYEEKNHLLGFAAVDLNAVCPPSGEALPELVQLYVQERSTGKGIGSRLLKAARTLSLNSGGRGIWLTVKADNRRALQFYMRHGFGRQGTVFFELEEERHENYLLRQIL